MSVVNAGLGLYDLYQANESMDDALNDLNTGFAQARSDVVTTQQPYSDFGLAHMQDYNNMGEFSFDFNNDYLNSQNYRWLRDQGQQGVERSAAASPQGYLSGKTLIDLANWNQQFAQSQYQQEWERQKGAYDTNRAYHEFPITTGADAAKNLGDNLADISIGRGAANATIEAQRANLISSALGSFGAAINSRTGISGDLSSVGGIGGTFMTLAGDIIDSTGNIISNIWSGGGLDGNGNWGLLGDLGGIISGTYGDENYFLSGGEGGWYEGLPQDVLDTLSDDSWWDNVLQSVTEFGEDAWSGVVNWARGFF